MSAQGILDPANAAEAEMAALAHQCLVTTLDHSNANHINLILDVGTDGDEKHKTPVLRLSFSTSANGCHTLPNAIELHISIRG